MWAYPALAARFGARRLLVAGAGAFALRAVALPLLTDPVAASLTMLVHGAGFALLLVGGVTYVSRHAPPGAAATAQGLLTAVVYSLSMIVGPGLGGLAAGAWGLPVMFGISAAIGVGVLVVVLGLDFVWKDILPDSSVRQLLMLAACNVLVSLSLNVINGMAGQFSIGHAGFVGIGGYMNSITDELFSFTLSQPVWWLIFYAIFVGLNFVGVELSFRFTVFICLLSLAILAVFFVGALTKLVGPEDTLVHKLELKGKNISLVANDEGALESPELDAD